MNDIHVDSGIQFTNYNQLLHVTLRKKLKACKLIGPRTVYWRNQRR